MTYGPTDRLIAMEIGSFSLAGAQTKFSALQEQQLRCDPTLGGCGWSVTGYIDSQNNLVVWPQEQE